MAFAPSPKSDGGPNGFLTGSFLCVLGVLIVCKCYVPYVVDSHPHSKLRRTFPWDRRRHAAVRAAEVRVDSPPPAPTAAEPGPEPPPPASPVRELVKSAVRALALPVTATPLELWLGEFGCTCVFQGVFSTF